MLRLARRWGYLDQAPEIEVPKRPSGRLRYLELDEITRLLAACGESRNRYLLAIVTIAVNTGMRKSEILGLEWERINVSTSTITLYQTKSGKPRGVPINRAVYDSMLFTKRDQRAWGQIRTAFALALERAKIPAGFPVPRSAPHGRRVDGHAWGEPEGRAGDPRPRRLQDDPAVRAPEPGAPARRRGAAGWADTGSGAS